MAVSVTSRAIRADVPSAKASPFLRADAGGLAGRLKEAVAGGLAGRLKRAPQGGLAIMTLSHYSYEPRTKMIHKDLLV